MSPKNHDSAEDRRSERHHAEGARRVRRMIKAKVDLPTRHGGRVWLNSREHGGRAPRFGPVGEHD